MLVHEVVSAYRAAAALRADLGALAACSIERISHYLSAFALAYGTLDAAACSEELLASWLVSHPTWRSPSTRLDAVRTVIACFRWAFRKRLIERQPFETPDGLTPRPRSAIEADEFRQLMRTRGSKRRGAHRAVRLAAWFLWRVGMRTKEMRTSLWSDLDLPSGVIRLAHHKTEAQTGADRLIGLDDMACRVLWWMGHRPARDSSLCSCERPEPHAKSEHIFLSERGTAWTKDTFSAAFRRMRAEAGLDKRKSAYSLRHGFCVQAICNGVGERQIADQMGHSTTRQIAWYGRQSRLHIDHLRAVVRRAHERPHH